MEERVQLLNSDIFVLFALSLRRQPTLGGGGGAVPWSTLVFCFNHRKSVFESVITIKLTGRTPAITFQKHLFIGSEGKISEVENIFKTLR